MKADAYLNLEVCRVILAGLDQQLKAMSVLNSYLCDSLRLLFIVTGQVHWSQTSNPEKSIPSRKRGVSAGDVPSRHPQNLIV